MMSSKTNGLKRLAIFVTATAVITACGSTTEPPDTTVQPDSTTTEIIVTSEATEPLPAFPDQRTELSHGGTTWAVVLAGAETAEDPAMIAAEQAAVDAGYETGWTDCDEGAAEALGMPAGTITLSVYFETEEDAALAAAAFAARGVDGVVAEVRTFCLD